MRGRRDGIVCSFFVGQYWPTRQHLIHRIGPLHFTYLLGLTISKFDFEGQWEPYSLCQPAKHSAEQHLRIWIQTQSHERNTLIINLIIKYTTANMACVWSVKGVWRRLNYRHQHRHHDLLEVFFSKAVYTSWVKKVNKDIIDSSYSTP